MPTEKKIEAAANSQEFAEARTQFEKYRHLWPATAPYFRTPTYKPWRRSETKALLAQLDRALLFFLRGCGFESRRAHQNLRDDDD